METVLWFLTGWVFAGALVPCHLSHWRKEVVGFYLAQAALVSGIFWLLWFIF